MKDLTVQMDDINLEPFKGEFKIRKSMSESKRKALKERILEAGTDGSSLTVGNVKKVTKSWYKAFDFNR